MAGPTEFTLEAVRQYMLAQPEGRVTNHELVKYFRAWLTHPTEKESARLKLPDANRGLDGGGFRFAISSGNTTSLS